MKSRRTSLLIALFLMAATFATFSRVPTADFVNYDDHVHIYKNPYFHPVTPAGVIHFWINPFDKPQKPKTKEELYNSPYEQLYAPLTFTAWALLATHAQLPREIETLDIGPHTLSPAPFHCFSVILHILNVLLVYAVLRLLVENDYAAACGALLFGVHPIQVEAVSWITSANNLVSGAWALAALWLFLRAVISSDSVDASDSTDTRVLDSKMNWKLYGGASLCYLLALFSKPSAVTLPLMILAIVWWKRPLELRRSILLLLPWLLVGGAFVLLNQSLQLPPDADIITPLWARPFLVGDAFAFYLSKIALPLGLTTDYGRMPHLVLSHWWGYATWILPAALLFLVGKKRFDAPWLLCAALILAVNVLPTSGIVPYYYHKHSTVADRYLYLGMLGAALALACACRPVFESWTARRSRAVAVFIGAWLCVLGSASYAQTQYWHDSFALWKRLAEVKPDGWRGQTNFAQSLSRRGFHDAALQHFQKALELYPTDAGMNANLGDALAERGQMTQAVKLWQTALRLDANYTDARIQIANGLKAQGKTAEAMAQYQEALRRRPDSAGAHFNLGILLSERNQLPQAVAHFQAALKINPDDAETHNALALALARQNDIAGASSHWETALRLKPEYSEAHVNYGTLLAMSGHLNEAISHWQTALRLNPKNAQVHHNLATALWSQGQKSEAIEHWKTALHLQPNYPAAQRALAAAMTTK